MVKTIVENEIKPCREPSPLLLKSWHTIGGSIDLGTVAVCRNCGEIYISIWRGQEHIQLSLFAISQEVVNAIAKGVITTSLHNGEKVYTCPGCRTKNALTKDDIDNHRLCPQCVTSNSLY